MSGILQGLFSVVEAIVGISDVIQVHFFLCVLVTGSLLCGNARHLALLVSGRRGRRHWLSVSSFVMLSAFRSRVMTLNFSQPYSLSVGWSSPGVVVCAFAALSL